MYVRQRPEMTIPTSHPDPWRTSIAARPGPVPSLGLFVNESASQLVDPDGFPEDTR